LTLVRIDISLIYEQIGETQPFAIKTDAVGIDALDCWVYGEIAVSGQVTNIGGAFQLRANVASQARMECSRCLKSFEQPVEFVFEDEFATEEIRPQGDWIDISAAIREALIFQEPMKPLCSEECQGICACCGADLNQTECGCDLTVIDPRLAGLQRLLEK
jgi:uncharacterized protein